MSPEPDPSAVPLRRRLRAKRSDPDVTAGLRASLAVTGSPRKVRDRDVVLLLALLVVAVLAINLVSGLVPGLDQLLANAPVLVIVLVVGTCLVVLGVVRRSR